MYWYSYLMDFAVEELGGNLAFIGSGGFMLLHCQVALQMIIGFMFAALDVLAGLSNLDSNFVLVGNTTTLV